MERRDFEKGIKYLEDKFTNSWNSIIESACRDNLSKQPEPKRSKFLTYAGEHIYGPFDILICEGKCKELVFASMLKNGRCSAPTLDKTPIYTGKIEKLLPFQDMIVRLVDKQDLVVYNVTLPQHILFPGFVKLLVCEKDSKTVVSVSGEGVGNWARLNAFFGPLIFKRILTRHLIPAIETQ